MEPSKYGDVNISKFFKVLEIKQSSSHGAFRTSTRLGYVKIFQDMSRYFKIFQDMSRISTRLWLQLRLRRKLMLRLGVSEPPLF